jgi:hypothetical protein
MAQATGRAGAVPPLPVLRGGDVDHPEWRAYVKWVYGEDVPQGQTLDLNAFSWFYSTAPLGPALRPLDHNDTSQALPLHTAWNCAGLFQPECKFSSYGFFVTQPAPDASAEAWTSSGRIEVLRIQFPEVGAAWFYHAVGSGVFLNLDALPTRGSVSVSRGLPEDWRGGLFDDTAAAYMLDHGCSLLIMTHRFADARSEIVVRGPDAAAGLGVACPFAAGAFSTGLSTPRPCECASESVELLNCRREVWQVLRDEGRYRSWWLDFSVWFACLLQSVGVGCLIVVALWMQLGGRRN